MAHPNSEHATGLLLIAIILSFVVASSLNVYPLSPNMATLRPMALIMVLIFGCCFSRAMWVSLPLLPLVLLQTYLWTRDWVSRPLLLWWSR